MPGEEDLRCPVNECRKRAWSAGSRDRRRGWVMEALRHTCWSVGGCGSRRYQVYFCSARRKTYMLCGYVVQGAHLHTARAENLSWRKGHGEEKKEDTKRKPRSCNLRWFTLHGQHSSMRKGYAKIDFPPPLLGRRQFWRRQLSTEKKGNLTI